MPHGFRPHADARADGAPVNGPLRTRRGPPRGPTQAPMAMRCAKGWRRVGPGDRADRHADRMADRFAVGHARAWGMLLWGRLSVYDSK
jgi:hypothetical protein